jgi:tRNA/rRNA methyltransferase
MSHALPAIILVRPRNPNNIGAVARAMNNFGFKELIVVAPHPPVWNEAIGAAVGAENVITNARVVASVREAVEDFSSVIGTVDRRRLEGQTPQELVESLGDDLRGLALLFGPEKTGLSNEDLSHCHKIVNIPTSPDCPSMNLGHAVAICCYELSRIASNKPSALSTKELPVTNRDVELLLNEIQSTLRQADFLSASNEERLKLEIRRSLLGYRINRRELALWLGALRRISHAIKKEPDA